MAYLHLNLKGEYFDKIKAGEKNWEYRLYNEYWKKRLMKDASFKSWEKIVIKRGYPKSNDHEKQIMRPWVGAIITTIEHPHFGPDPVKVFAIRVN